MTAKEVKYLTRDEVVKIVDEKNVELYKCFNKLISDVEGVKAKQEGMSRSQTRIERALLGDADFDDIGISKMVNVAYTHARRIEEGKFMKKAEKVINHWDRWQESGFWKLLESMIDNYKVLKVITVLIVGSGFLSLANVVKIVIDWLSNFSN